jgi:hypothetical protein
MKSLRDEIRLAAGDMDGFNFIQADGLDFICKADFILAIARISLKLAQPRFISRLGIAHFQGDFTLQIVGFLKNKVANIWNDFLCGFVSMLVIP